MTTSGTFGFAPGGGEVILNALSRCQIRGPSVAAEHMLIASQEANLLQSEWSNRGPTLWTVDDQLVPCVIGQATYTVPGNTIMVLDVTIGTAPLPLTNEIRITSLSRSEYMSYPNKTQQGRPTSYWFDRLIAPTITLWPVPDSSTSYYLHYFRFRQIQDAVTQNATGMEIPYRWLDAACAGMAVRLARHFAPALVQPLKMDYDNPNPPRGAYQIAADQDTEDANLSLVPGLAGYYRP